MSFQLNHTLTPSTPIEEILENYVPEPNTGCWLWLGRLNRYGYPVQRFAGAAEQLIHRMFYRVHKKENIEGKVLHHLCKEKSCVNPEHLQVINSIAEHSLLHKKVKGKPYKVTEEIQEKIKELYAIHKSVHIVGSLLKLSPTTVGTALSRMKKNG